MDQDPHGSAFIFLPGSGSRRVNMSTKNLKNVRKLLITATLLSFLKVNLHKLHCFLLLSNLLGFLKVKKTLHDFFSSNLVRRHIQSTKYGVIIKILLNFNKNWLMFREITKISSKFWFRVSQKFRETRRKFRETRN